MTSRSILHTSGSTGRPKRVPLSHANLTISAHNVAATYALTADDVSLCVMPLFHVHGLVASTLATLATGGTVVVPGKFSPLSFWRVAKEYGATWYSAVPTIHQLLLARVEPGAAKPAGAEKLRFIRSCSASLPPQVMHDLEAAFGAPVLEAYGMTEAAHQMASNPLPPDARKPGVGRPRHRRRHHASATATARCCPPASAAKSASGAPTSITGYENNPEANATAFFDGWFRTGDQGFLDADGYLTLSGRLKEMINRGGEKISPREIDEVLLTHPAVGEAVCFGVPHKMWGEEVAAAVTLKGAATEAELLAFCKEHLAEFKRPKQIHITEAIPRTATGKIQRRVVAQAFAAQGLHEDRHRRRRCDRRLPRRQAGARRRRRRAVRPRTAPARHAGARTAGDRRGGEFEVRPQVTGDLASIGPADVVFLGVKAHALTALAPTLAPLFGPDTVVVSTQNGIPWWYFQGVGGELNGSAARARRSRAASSPARSSTRRVVGSLAYFATDLRRARSGPSHRGQPHQLRRARRQQERAGASASPTR